MNTGGIKLAASGVGTVINPEGVGSLMFVDTQFGRVIAASIIDGNTGEHIGGDPPQIIHLVSSEDDTEKI